MPVNGYDIFMAVQALTIFLFKNVTIFSLNQGLSRPFHDIRSFFKHRLGNVV